MGPEAEATRAVLRDLGLRVGELRRERGLTQEATAERLNMLTPNFARIEQGRQNVTIDTLVRIARVLGVPIRDLLTRPTSRRVRLGRPPKRTVGAPEERPRRRPSGASTR